MAPSKKSFQGAFSLKRQDSITEVYLNRLMAALDAAFVDVLDKKASFEEVERQILELGLTRINELLIPASERLVKVAELGFLIAFSQTERTLEVGQPVNLTINEGDQRDLFTPSPLVILTREGDPDFWAVARTINYLPALGDFNATILEIHGSPGPYSDWIVGALAGTTIAGIEAMEQAQAARDLAAGSAVATGEDREAVGILRAATAEDREAAETAAGAAGTALTDTQAVLTAFGEIYLQAVNGNPDPLPQIGAMWLDTSATPNTVKVMTETGPAPAVSVSIGGFRGQDYPKQAYAAGATYNVDGGFTRGDVLINGTLQRTGVTFTPGEDGSFTIARAIEAHEEVSFRGYLANDAIDIYTKTEADTLFDEKLAKSSNLDDLPDKSQALSNIGGQADLGFTPIQQGGGSGQLLNQVKIGWSGAGLKAQVDELDLGLIWTDVSAGKSFSGDAGYQIFPSGLIFQWGRETTSRGSDYQVTFPTTFPNAVLFSPAKAVGYIAPFREAFAEGVSNSAMNIRIRDTSGAGVSANVHWCAWGY